jgi:hypothetical protein
MRRSRFPRKWSCKLFFAREREKGDDLVDFLGTTAESRTAEKLQAIVDLDLDELLAVEPPRGYGRD